MYPRMANVVLGIWLFISAFLWPHAPAQMANTEIVGVLCVVFGLVAMGGLALGAIAMGGLAAGGIAVGGLSAGALSVDGRQGRKKI